MLVWTEQAEQDKDSIIDYIALDNPRAAINVGDEIERQVEMLIEFPNMGRIGRVEWTRELVISDTPYVVAYRVRGDAVIVLRVLHGARQWPKGFGEGTLNIVLSNSVSSLPSCVSLSVKATT